MKSCAAAASPGPRGTGQALPADEARAEQIFDQVRLRNGQTVLALELTLILSIWGQWRTMALVTAIAVACAFINMVLAPGLQRWGGRRLAEVVIAARERAWARRWRTAS